APVYLVDAAGNVLSTHGALEAAQVPAIVRGPLVAAAAQQPGEPVFVDDTDGVRRAYAAMVVPHAAGGHLRIVRGVD
ncbi:hypothetical protein, partial [Salmonella enterica]